ncbi:MAG: hypothetical protein ACRCSF_00635 [Mycobacteriaceae bacterium]
MYVLTVDQRRSRSDIDRVEELLEKFNTHSLLRPFERTAGDEVQAVTDSSSTALNIAVELSETGYWSIGIGIGSVETPLPQQTRAGRGLAFEAAREAVTRAKNSAQSVAVTGSGDKNSQKKAEHAQTALRLLLSLINKRSEQGREAVALIRTGVTQAVAASQLGISKQAMSQRLAAAEWAMEPSAKALVDFLLKEADQ